MANNSAKAYCVAKGTVYLLTQCNISENKELNMETISYASHKKIWWQCSKGHKWQSSISDRLMKDAGCPYCANKKVLAGFNDLETMDPELALQWHPTKNGTLLPADVIAGSDKVVWWQCELGHEWRANIENRSLKKQGCPFCTGKRAWPGFNDLATLCPDLMKEWHPTLNADLNPYKLRPASAKRAWWICSEGHVWDSYIFNRTAKSKPGCPICAGNQKPSKQAEWIAKAQEKERRIQQLMNYELQLILKKITEPLVCVLGDKETEYLDGIDAKDKIKGQYQVESIGAKDGKVVLNLVKDTRVANDTKEAWAQEYKRKTGEDVGFF